MDDRDGPSPDALRNEIERLRAENRRLRSLLGLDVPEPATAQPRPPPAWEPTLFRDPSAATDRVAVDGRSSPEAEIALFRSLFAGESQCVLYVNVNGEPVCREYVTEGDGLKTWGGNFYGQLGAAAAFGNVTPVDVLFTTHQTIGLRASKPAGTIARGTAVSFAATVTQLPYAKTPAVVRFIVYRKVDGAWRLFSQRTATADWNNRATLRWTFSRAGSWYVKAEARAVAAYGASGWSPSIRYSVR